MSGLGLGTVSEGIARPVRGAAQSGIGFVLTDLLDEFTVWNPSTRQYGLAVLVLSVLASAAQNFAENKGWVKAFLRSVPEKEVPFLDA